MCGMQKGAEHVQRVQVQQDRVSVTRVISQRETAVRCRGGCTLQRKGTRECDDKASVL